MKVSKIRFLIKLSLLYFFLNIVKKVVIAGFVINLGLLSYQKAVFIGKMGFMVDDFNFIGVKILYLYKEL